MKLVMKSPDDLKRETTALIQSEHAKRVDAQPANQLRHMILDLYDAIDEGRITPSDKEPAPRHPPRLKVVP